MVSPMVDRRLGLVGNIAMKAPVTALAVGNITQSGEQTIDGVAVLASNASGVPDRVLCVGQTVASQNGIWDVSTGSWTRSKDADGNYDFGQGSTVLVNNGSTYAGSYWKITTAGPITIGTTLLAWARALANSISTLSFLQAGTGARSRGAQDKMREWLSVMDFGAIADGGTHPLSERYATLAAAQVDYPFVTSLTQSIDWAATTAAVRATKSANYPSRSRTVYMPVGDYYFSDTLQIFTSVQLQGDGNAYPNGVGTSFWPNTAIKFAANIDGFRIYAAADSPAPPATGMYAYLRDLTLYTVNYVPGTVAPAGTGVGIRATTTFYAHNVRVLGFSDNGWDLQSGAAGISVDQSMLILCDSWNNRGRGFYTQGGDANVILFQQCNAGVNGGVGFYDSSFLANVYLSCHGSGNSALTQPGTGYFVDYKTTNVNSACTFLGCYSEGGVNEISYPGTVLGGSLARGISAGPGHGGGGAPYIQSGGLSVGAPHYHINEGSPSTRPFFKAGGQDAINTVFTFGKTDSSFYNVVYNPGTSNFRFLLNNGISVMDMPDAAGRILGPQFPGGVYLGGAQIALLTFGSAPAAGTWSRGDIVLNDTPAGGGFIGWVCVLGGTPGTWKTFGAITP